RRHCPPTRTACRRWEGEDGRDDPRVRRPGPGLLRPFRRRRSEAVGKRLAVVLVVTMMASGSVLCASAQELRQVDPVVVTATKIAGPRSQVGATVTVITEAELKTYNYLTVARALMQVPVLDVHRQGRDDER